jgi:pimeloyl-ACP methyl ester carboxylesterase
MKTFKNQRLNPNFQENLKTEIASSEKEIRQPKDNISPKSKTLYANYIPEEYLNEESVEETEEERVTELKLNDKSNNINNENGIKKLITINSMIHHIDYISTYKIVKAPEKSLKEKICALEKQLFELMNMEYGKEIIYEDFVLVNDNQNYYVHMLRTAQLDPKKENFLLIHGFLSSSTHFLSILPYLLLKYNVFIPDTIGMGLSSRPQISFDSPEQCENYFIEIIYILVKKIFFSNNYNIKKDFFIGGHSLGGFMVSHYIIKYPIGIKKVLLLSAAGITDYRIRGTNIHKEAGKLFGCILSFLSCCWACRPRIQCCYRCICCSKFIKTFMETYSITIDQTYIKRNKDGTPFKVDVNRINYVLGQLSKLTLDFPDDIYKCMFYMFTLPPPASVNPVELHLLNHSNLSCVFIYGENDWMDRTGAFRLCQQDRERFKLFIIRNSGHSFAMENPKELINILELYF